MQKNILVLYVDLAAECFILGIMSQFPGLNYFIIRHLKGSDFVCRFACFKDFILLDILLDFQSSLT